MRFSSSASFLAGSWILVASSSSSRSSFTLPLASAWVPSTLSSSFSTAAARSRVNPTRVVVGGLGNRKFSSSSSLYATVEEDAAATTQQQQSSLLEQVAATTSAPRLKDEYVLGFHMVIDKLKQVLPEAYQATMMPMLQHFLYEYMAASQSARQAALLHNEKDESILQATTPAATAERFLTVIKYGLTYGSGPNKFIFDVQHTALRGRDPALENGNLIDFYEFGCSFFRPCMDMYNSVVLGKSNLEQAMAQLAAGDNVVFFANHQTEADPQVMSVFLERMGYDKYASDMVYVAGHKVTTDPLAVAFSMGRNLICIHSKKHINADLESKPLKQRQNLRAMNKLLETFKAGGTFLWVAPSGGRDRRDVSTGKVPIAPFDKKTIDMFRVLGNKASKTGGITTHYYTLAMVTYDMVPPPDHVEAGVGESRNIRFVPVGIAVGKERDNIGGLESRDEFTRDAFLQCEQDYQALLQAIQEKVSQNPAANTSSA